MLKGGGPPPTPSFPARHDSAGDDGAVDAGLERLAVVVQHAHASLAAAFLNVLHELFTMLIYIIFDI